MIKAVFFDAGETLIHRNPSLVAIVSRLIKKAGYKIKIDKISIAIEETAKNMKKIVEKAIMTDSAKWDYFLKDVLLKLKVRDKCLLEHIKNCLKNGTSFRAYPEVLGVLKELRSKKIILGVISNASASLEAILDRAGLKKYIDHMVISEVEGVEKPHKKIFDIALTKTGVKKNEFIFIGDNYIADVQGAAKAGLAVVWLSRPTLNAQFSFSHTAKKNTHMVKNLREFLQYMKKEKMI
ncbi:MAG: HAD family hydrolase [bacterium]